jgi:septum formation protein
MKAERVILASASPRRAELLKEIFDEFEIVPSFAEEKTDEISPEKAAMDLAAKKANEVFGRLLRGIKNEPAEGTASISDMRGGVGNKEFYGESANDRDVLIVACDTIVCLDGEFLGKPANERAAFETLKKLNGRAHEVYSGVCLIYRAKPCRPGGLKEDFEREKPELDRGIEPRFLSRSERDFERGTRLPVSCEARGFFDVSRVFFKYNSDGEIREYIKTFAPFDKAGAYGVQDGRLIERYEGSYKNIVGLPTEKIKKELQKPRSANMGYAPQNETEKIKKELEKPRAGRMKNVKL